MREIIKGNRSFVMGIAILWIALYHIPMHTSFAGLKFIQDIGYGGVDIFVFVSGFGIYMSLERDSDAFSFLVRRMKRLLPSYIPFIIIWMLVRFITYQIYITEICGNLTMTGWWNGDANQFNWYIDCILLFYIASPYIYGAIKRSSNNWILLLVLSGLISLSFLHGQLLMAMTRLPLFVLGMVVADARCKFITETTYGFLIMNIITVLGFVLLYMCLYVQDRMDKWHYGLWWYPFILITPGLIWDIGLLGEKFLRVSFLKPLYVLISNLGKASFELFLLHLFIFETAQAKGVKGNTAWILLFVSAFVIGYGYHIMIDFIFKKIKDK